MLAESYRELWVRVGLTLWRTGRRMGRTGRGMGRTGRGMAGKACP